MTPRSSGPPPHDNRTVRRSGAAACSHHDIIICQDPGPLCESKGGRLNPCEQVPDLRERLDPASMTQTHVGLDHLADPWRALVHREEPDIACAEAGAREDDLDAVLEN